MTDRSAAHLAQNLPQLVFRGDQRHTRRNPGRAVAVSAVACAPVSG
jgi:hypothetical protein